MNKWIWIYTRINVNLLFLTHDPWSSTLENDKVLFSKSFDRWIGKMFRPVLALFRMGIFGAAHGWEGQKDPFPKICHTYPTMMKLGRVILYLKKIQKIFQSLDIPPEFCWHQNFFTREKQILLYQEIDVDCILIHNF